MLPAGVQTGAPTCGACPSHLVQTPRLLSVSRMTYKHIPARIHTHKHFFNVAKKGLGSLNVESRIKIGKNFIVLDFLDLKGRISKTQINKC